MSKHDREINRRRSSTRARGEHAFHVIKDVARSATADCSRTRCVPTRHLDWAILCMARRSSLAEGFSSSNERQTGMKSPTNRCSDLPQLTATPANSQFQHFSLHNRQLGSFCGASLNHPVTPRGDRCDVVPARNRQTYKTDTQKRKHGRLSDRCCCFESSRKPMCTRRI